jgi:hypothetical protein
MDDPARWHFGLDSIQEADELLMPMALHTATDHPAVEHVKRGEQRGGAVASKSSLALPGILRCQVVVAFTGPAPA